MLITDGAPQRSGNSITTRYVEEAAQQLKDRDVNLVTVGLGIDNVTSGKILLYDIADVLNNEKMFYSAKTGDELEDVLLQIVKTIMIDATVQGNVSDTINEAFYPVNKNTGKPLEAGQMVDLQGNVTTDASQPHGTITYKEVNVGTEEVPVMEYRYGVEWTAQDFTWEGWHGSVYIKAKEDFLGGNAVKTNTGSATVEATSYKTSENGPSVALADKKYINNDLAQGEDPHYVRTASFESPRVNVNELGFLWNDTEWNVYLGTSVDPLTQIKKLWDEILVSEVVKDEHATDSNGDGLPDKGIADEDNNWYPLTPDSIVDDREGEGTGDKQTFKMADLIKLLAESVTNPGEQYAWWDYTKHEPNWEEFLKRATTGSGIVLPYHVYGLNDNSSITITLTKEIIDGEKYFDDNSNDVTLETGLHATKITGDAVEKYTLKILYSPDYSVLPEGQGGGSTTDFHTGIYGTTYQGHAAGTETSTNTHTINVYAEPLDVLKKDDHGENVPGAVFKLYRAAKQGETGEPLSSYDASLTGSYYCISTATSGEDGIAHLAPDDMTMPTHTIPVAAGQTAQNLLVPLAAGETYYLVEDSAPSGYRKDDTVKTVTVEIGPDFYTKLDKTTAVDAGDNSVTPARPTVAYNWDEGVTFIVKDLGADSTKNQATLVNHDTREAVTLKDAGGNERTYMLRSDSEQQVVTQVLILNNVVVDIKIKKTDLNGQGLAGAVFQMKAVNGLEESEVEGVTGIGTVSKTIDGETRTFTSAFETTGGEQTFSDLPDGTYRLYEAYVPAGYISTFRYIQFTIENRVMKDVTTDSGTSDKVVPTAADGNSLALLTIKNTPGAALPNTGGPGTNLIYLFGIMLTGLAGTGILMKRRRRNAA